MKAPCLLLVRSCFWENKAPLFPLALPTGWAFPAARGADQQLADSHHWLPSILSITWRWVLRRRGPKSDGQMDRKMCLSILLACLLFFLFSFFLSLFFLFFFFSFLPQKLTSNTHCSVTCSFYFMIYLNLFQIQQTQTFLLFNSYVILYYMSKSQFIWPVPYG